MTMAAPATDPRRRCRVASYNIHRCVGLDGRRDAGRIAAVLRELDADVIGLQEVDQHAAHGAAPARAPAVIGAGADAGDLGEPPQLHDLADALGLHAVAGPTLRLRDMHYGNALLTRRRVLAVRHLDLTVYRREPRAAIDVDIDVDGEPIRVVATHLGLLPGERRVQVRRIIDALDRRTSRIVVLCGDINEWFAVGRPLRWLHARLGRAPTLPTFPAGFPIFALDRIWIAPRAAAVRQAVHATPTARRASDHLPLAADLDLDAVPA
jgi:endonuclease/exonuclease/phosphatase family metal-dependent hydrolase